jgi:hypothetical protein
MQNATTGLDQRDHKILFVSRILGYAFAFMLDLYHRDGDDTEPVLHCFNAGSDQCPRSDDRVAYLWQGGQDFLTGGSGRQPWRCDGDCFEPQSGSDFADGASAREARPDGEAQQHHQRGCRAYRAIQQGQSPDRQRQSRGSQRAFGGDRQFAIQRAELSSPSQRAGRPVAETADVAEEGHGVVNEPGAAAPEAQCGASRVGFGKRRASSQRDRAIAGRPRYLHRWNSCRQSPDA